MRPGARTFASPEQLRVTNLQSIQTDILGDYGILSLKLRGLTLEYEELTWFLSKGASSGLRPPRTCGAFKYVGDVPSEPRREISHPMCGGQAMARSAFRSARRSRRVQGLRILIVQTPI